MTELDRRALLIGSGMGVAGAAFAVASASPVDASVTAPGRTTIRIGGQAIHVVDLTHRLTSDFNVTPGRPRIAMDPIVGSGYDAGMNLNRLLLVEHTGTHIDAPRHFDNGGRSLGEIPIGDLVVPLAVIDIRAAVAADPDAALMPEDVLCWERKWGKLPAGCCVAIQTGFDVAAAHAKAAASGATASGALRMPGFSPEVCEMLIRERDVKGIALELGSLDRGSNVPSYPVHRRWLRSGRWGLEMLTNLDAVPPSGAILIVGAAPIKDATGIPIRAFALF
jgi:kynurenine formamidase